MTTDSFLLTPGTHARACPVCDGALEPLGVADYYMPGKVGVTYLLRCRRCDAIVRDLPTEAVPRHCDAASYTQLAAETRFLRQRVAFFRFLGGIYREVTGRRPTRSLDIGCSYGHLLEVLRESGCETSGVEANVRARAVAEERGFHIGATPAEVAARGPFDFITLVDSIYYVPDPVALMLSLRGLLTDDGIVLMRVANRNWILKALARFGRAALRRMAR